ncbi:MAG: diguanylate cyclase [Phycisphaerae bacterium]|nr:diguanylate cyclase [Phycisphaerae bacterium]
MRILIAEDDPFSRRFLTRTVAKWGYEVETACDGDEAWEVLRQENAPRLAIIDWVMPGLNGPELCRCVRQQKTSEPAYLIMLTGKGQTADLVEAMEAGADDFATKSTDVRELKARLRAGKRIVELQDDLLRLATRDSLTGLWNRRAILDALDCEVARAERHSTSIGVILADLDRFKQVNDSHGHAAGDAVLAEVAGRMSNALRDYDTIGRYGGEEFLIVLPDPICAEAATVAERIRTAVESKPISYEEQALSVSVSCGVAVSDREQNLDADELIRAADVAMYQAKAQGRNRVNHAPSTDQIGAI